MRASCSVRSDQLFHIPVELTFPKAVIAEALGNLTITENFIVDTGSPRSFLSELRARKSGVKVMELPEGLLSRRKSGMAVVNVLHLIVALAIISQASSTATAYDMWEEKEFKAK